MRRSCKLDYSGDDVTAENFLAVLTGDAGATNGKPVLRSNARDRVFGESDLVCITQCDSGIVVAVLTELLASQTASPFCAAQLVTGCLVS